MRPVDFVSADAILTYLASMAMHLDFYRIIRILDNLISFEIDKIHLKCILTTNQILMHWILYTPPLVRQTRQE